MSGPLFVLRSSQGRNGGNDFLVPEISLFVFDEGFFNVMASGGLYFYYLHHSLQSSLIIYFFYVDLP